MFLLILSVGPAGLLLLVTKVPLPRGDMVSLFCGSSSLGFLVS